MPIIFSSKMIRKNAKNRCLIDINWRSLNHLLVLLVILEIQNYYFSTIFEKKNSFKQIFSSISFKISPIVTKKIWYPEPHNLTEVWAGLSKKLQIFRDFVRLDGPPCTTKRPRSTTTVVFFYKEFFRHRP